LTTTSSRSTALRQHHATDSGSSDCRASRCSATSSHQRAARLRSRRGRARGERLKLNVVTSIGRRRRKTGSRTWCPSNWPS
jgi:hypothetical protein